MAPPSSSSDDSEPNSLLTLNYQRLRLAQSPSDAEVVKLVDAVRGLGFFYLDLRHGFPPSASPDVDVDVGDNDALLQEARGLFGVMTDFFNLPVPEKQTYSVTNNGGYFGYKGMGKSFVDKQGTPDANEFYNLSKDDMLDQLHPPLPHPPLIQAQRPLIKAFILHSHAVVMTLLSHISASLGLSPSRPEHASSADVLPSLHHLSLSSEDHISFIKYPGSDDSANVALQPNQPLASHTDYGTLTLLFSSSPGLQVLVPGPRNDHDASAAPQTQTQDRWLDVAPRPGHAVVNCGDALALLTNKLLRSNVHRVASQVQRASAATRYSLGYFARPANDVRLRPLPGIMVPRRPPLQKENGQQDSTKGFWEGGEEEEEEEEAVTSKEWVLRRSYGRLLDCYEGQHTWAKTVGTEVMYGDVTPSGT